MYYLFHDKTDVRTLRQRLEIEARKHGYTIEYGRKNFEAIKDRERRDEIETILQDREERTASLFEEG